MANFTNWDSRELSLVSTSEVYAAGIVFPIVCVTVTGLRFYVRSTQKFQIGIDDWLILFALVNICGMGICFIVGAAKGAMGSPSPVPDTEMDEKEYLSLYTLIEKLNFILQIFIILACGFVKLSIIFLLRRLFLIHRPSRFGYITAAMAVLITSWTVAFFFAEIFGCGVHVNGYWSTQERDFKYCSDLDTAIAAFVISSFITDLMTLLLPIPMIWKLSLTTVKKIQVTGVFLLGLFAVAASIGRMAVVLKAESLNKRFYLDPNRTLTTQLWWSLIEAGVAYITACLPVLFPLANRQRLRSLSKSLRSELFLRHFRLSNLNSSQSPLHGASHELESGRKYSRKSDTDMGEAAEVRSIR